MEMFVFYALVISRKIDNSLTRKLQEIFQFCFLCIFRTLLYDPEARLKGGRKCMQKSKQKP